MTTTEKPTARTGRLGGTPVERVATLAADIAAGGDEAQKLTYAPRWCIDKLIDAGIFRFTLPAVLGGEDASANDAIEVVEAVSAIDGSIGWAVMIGSEINALAAGGMPMDLAREVYLQNPRVIMCGGGGPGTTPARAVKERGSWRLWAHSTFLSGCHNSEWCFQSAPLYDGDTPILTDKGQPTVRTFMVHKSQFKIVEGSWDMAALRGSGSHDVVVEGQYIEPKYEPAQLMLPAIHPNPVFRMPVNMRLSFNKAAVATGVCRGVLDEFTSLAQAKTPWLSSSLLKDRPSAQARLGEGEATLRAARAFLFQSMDSVAASLANGEPAPSMEALKVARLACTFAAQSSLHVVDAIHNAAGTTGIRMDSPLERKLRDAHGAASHRWVSSPLYEEIGRLFLGFEPTALFQ